MEDHELDARLAQLRDVPRPQLTGMFRHDVWREIRLRKGAQTRRSTSWGDWFSDLWGAPKFGLSAIAVAIMLGVGAGLFQPYTMNSKTRDALDLGVFGSSSPGLLVTLIKHSE